MLHLQSQVHSAPLKIVQVSKNFLETSKNIPR